MSGNLAKKMEPHIYFCIESGFDFIMKLLFFLVVCLDAFCRQFCLYLRKKRFVKVKNALYFCQGTIAPCRVRTIVC